ncbi:MAG: hypothetical protein CM15mV5_0890 [uncultured marine virus]|nr:MAG: hypothetical protein CM15mV5_0890 [uncultured marine virus]
MGKKVHAWCDLNSNIMEWGSEEFFIPYRSPVDKRFIGTFLTFM